MFVLLFEVKIKEKENLGRMINVIQAILLLKRLDFSASVSIFSYFRQD